MSLYIQPYAAGSDSAKVLSQTLREHGLTNRRLKVHNSAYKGHPKDLVINWGSSRHRDWVDVANVLNHPRAVSNAANKIKTLQRLKNAGVNVPEFTTDYLQALDWIHHDGLTIASRTDIRGHSGKGMVISNTADHLPKADLFTQFNLSKGEYRFHVFHNQVIDYAKKRRKTGEPPVGIEKSIRSHDNGWIYTRNNADGAAIPIPDGFTDEAIHAVQAIGLDFGAVDVLNVDGRPMILEINSAPGLKGDITRTAYAEAIKSYIGD